MRLESCTRRKQKGCAVVWRFTSLEVSLPSERLRLVLLPQNLAEREARSFQWDNLDHLTPRPKCLGTVIEPRYLFCSGRTCYAAFLKRHTTRGHSACVSASRDDPFTQTWEAN